MRSEYDKYNIKQVKLPQGNKKIQTDERVSVGGPMTKFSLHVHVVCC